MPSVRVTNGYRASPAGLVGRGRAGEQVVPPVGVRRAGAAAGPAGAVAVPEGHQDFAVPVVPQDAEIGAVHTEPAAGAIGRRLTGNHPDVRDPVHGTRLPSSAAGLDHSVTASS